MEDTKEMDYVEETESGLTLGEIFKVIFRRVWWVLGAAAVCLVVLTLVMQLWYNKNHQYYSLSYEIVYPDSASGKYPNGSDLFAEESISYGTLTDIKNGKYSTLEPDEFKNIDVGDMCVNDNISISEKVERGADGNVKRTYLLTVKSKYFGSDSQARTFMRTVAKYPLTRVKTIMAEKEFGVYLSTAYSYANTYEEKINALVSQKNYIEEEYTKLKGYGELADVGIASLHNLFTTAQQNDLRAHISAEKYVYDKETYKAEAATQKASLELQIENNNKVIEALRDEQKNASTTAETDPYDERIASLTQQNGELKNRIDTITQTLSAIEEYSNEASEKYAAKQAFDAQLEGYYNQLVEAAETLKTVSVTVYNDNSRVVYSSNKLEKQGGIHWILAAVLGAVIGFVVASAVICIIDLPKYKRGKLAAEGVEKSEEGEKKVEKSEPDAE